MTVALKLAEFLTNTPIEALPAQAMDHAAMVVASTFASAACGTAIESARIISALAHDAGGKPEAHVWYHHGAALPVTAAAQANAVLSDAAASDDSDLRNIVHAGTPLTSASLAIGERDRRPGAEVMAAIVLGYEAAGRISGAITPSFKNRGFHGCLGAAFAAAGAAARMLRLDALGMARTLALTATSMGGLATAADTSVAREYHAGAAVLAGMNAARAAQRGFAAELSILESPQGFFEAFGGVDGQAAGEHALRDLGAEWDIVTDMAVKLVPGGHPYHAFAEAAANAAREANLAPEQIAAIELSRPGFTSLPGPLHPADLIDMAHSPAYFAAAGAADRGFGWQHAGPAKIADPVIHALIDKVRVGPEPTEDRARYRQGARVTIRATDGRAFTSVVFLPKGSGALGIDWADVDAKYQTLMPASGLPPVSIDSSLEMIHGLRGLADISTLTRLLHAPRP